MIDPKHTPGPWRFDHDWHRLPTIFAADGKTKVATIEKISGDQRTPEQEADARLIETAPELFDALLEFISTFSTVPGSIGDEVRQKARAAIAKAQGIPIDHLGPR